MATSSKEHVDKDAAAAYEYLCRFEEAKKWIEAILMETLPPSMELENYLPNGVLLCALGKKLLPNDPMWKKMYDPDQAKFKAKGLDYRHTDNVNFWLASLNKLGLPRFFLPSVEDIYHKKNFPRLIYCIHALSYFLKKQNLIGFSVDDLTKGKPTFSSDELSHTSLNLSKIDTLPSFNSLGALVEEELQYKALGLVESMQGDEIKPENGGSQDPLSPVPEFDDPQYIPFSATLTKEVLAAAAAAAATATQESLLVPVLCLPCRTAGVHVSLYARKYPEKHKNGLSEDVERALEKVNEALDKGDVQAAFEGLGNKALALPFVFKEPHTYFSGLMEERKSGIPGSVLCVYSGISRETCESILGVQGFGAYLIRDSKVETGTFLFSFRNQSGVKHWRIMCEGGYYLWSGTRYTFDEFFEKFLVSLSNTAKVYTFQTVTASLRIALDVENEQAVKILEGLRHDRRLTYGQLFSVVRTVNSDIRQSRKVPAAAMEVALHQPKHPSWDRSKVVSMSRNEADSVLNREGVPGSFLLRTSDTTPGDFALAFRTAKEVRHWKIACKGQKYFVHPRPNPYNSLEDIVAHFQEAVGQETKLLMTPLEVKTDKAPEKPTPVSERSNQHLPERASDRVPERASDRVPERAPDRVPEERAPERREKVLERVAEEKGVDRVPQERLPEGKVPERRDRVPERPDRLSDMSERQLTHSHSQSQSTLLTPGMGPTPSLSKLNPANLTSWTVDDVCQWLLEHDFGQYIEVFRYNAIDGECMLTLDNELLKTDLGVTALGHRARLLKRLNELKAYGR